MSSTLNAAGDQPEPTVTGESVSTRSGATLAVDDWSWNEKAGHNGIHVFTALLLAVAVGSSFRLELHLAGLNLLLCTIYAVFYFVGYDNMTRWSDFQKQAWVLTLTGVWVLEMMVAPVGVYLIFPLYFVILRAMPDIRGALSVFFVTAIAIVMQIPNGLTLGGVMGPLVSAAVTLAMFYAIRMLTRITKEREEAVRELIATRHELAESQHAEGVASERQRLAHEIHDTVAQGLSSIQMLLHVAKKEVAEGNQEKAIERIDLARTTASDNLAEARAMIAALQPVALSETSLESAINRMVATFAGAADIDVTVDVDGEQQELPMKVEATLLRIAQGAVGNVAKHSDATRCRVTITYAPEEVRLDVVDNGHGFDPHEVKSRPAGLGSVGLTAMRTRAAELGGHLEVESQVGGPTAVSAALPLPETAS